MGRYRGKHRAPSVTDNIIDNSGRYTATLVTTGVLAATPMVLTTGAASAAAPPEVEEAIIQCESSGNPRAQNSESSASGLYQFIDGTWKAYGGSTESAKDASVAVQKAVFQRAFAAEGTRPWNASKSCWGQKVGAVGPSNNPAPAPKKRSSGPAVDVRNADGTGQYTCDRAHLHFDACDPHNIGEVVDYPAYKGKHRAPEAKHRAPAGGGYTVKKGDTLAKIAVAHGTTWQKIYENTRGTVSNPDLIRVGAHLAL